jgi:toxin YoeB
MVKKINKLIKAISRDPFSGIGKPEALKHDLAGF